MGRDRKKLIGHVLIELSFLLCKFLARKGCHLKFSPMGSRYLEDGLVVPGNNFGFSGRQEAYHYFKEGTR